MKGRTAFRVGTAAVATASLFSGGQPRGMARPAPSAPPPAVIAVVESGGVNVLHTDFLTADGHDAELPPAARDARVVRLPRRGGFADRIAAARKGPLGNLREQTLYYLAGTRVLVYMPHDADGFDLFRDMEHATGTTSAAVGREYGTNPNALLVYVPASVGAWEWVREQTWIDVVSASYYTVVSAQPRCGPNEVIHSIAREGRVVFTASGNVEQAGLASSPAGAAAAYQVGGVDSEGKPYTPASSPNFAISGTTATRPYETGDRMEFPAASHERPTGPQEFGGTSGATPSTAGRASLLIEHARRLLGSTQNGVDGGALARARRGVPLPRRGPLADGELTGAELTDLLHHVAVPYTPPNPLRYYAEGYGALDEAAIARAKRVLDGKERLSARPDDDAQHERWETLREDVFQAACS